MKVYWTPEAEQDRIEIWDFIASDEPLAASRMDELFSATVTKLKDFPEMGKPGKVAGTRELIPHESYRLVYQVEGQAVWILAVVHTARMWPLLS